MKIKCKIKRSAAAILCFAGMAAFASGTTLSDAAEISEIYGDLNGDGTVNIIDSIYMKRYALGESEDFPVKNWITASDLSGNKEFSHTDISAINGYILGTKENIKPGDQIMQFYGIDVSKWQGVIDWKQVKDAGVEFAMIKAGEGLCMEETFLRNIAGAKENGIACGVYWFANARSISECHAEAAACIETIKNYKLEYPVVYDFEYRTVVNNPLADDRRLATDVIITFLSDIESAGYYPMVYSNIDFSQRYLELDRLTERFDFWFAHYDISAPDKRCNIWQRSCTGRIAGINADVDLDVSYRDYPQIMINNGLNGY